MIVLALKHSNVFILQVNDKMSTTFGILTLMSRINLMLSYKDQHDLFFYNFESKNLAIYETAKQ